MAPAIPDRWEDYIPVGKQIEGTRFICFKVPLEPSVIRGVEEENRLDYDGLLDAIPNLGLIIDLTDTFRYYDPYIFENKGVNYIKVRIPGKIIPPRGLVEMFKRHVHNYLKNNENNDKLIGVHCTHGVNRTGFLVCNYMISAMSHDADDAIQKFGAARGHEIERQNYLRALHNLNSNVIDNYERHRGYKRSYPNYDNWRSESNYKPKHFINYEDRWNSNSSKSRGYNSNRESYPVKRPRTYDHEFLNNDGINMFHISGNRFKSHDNQTFNRNRTHNPRNKVQNDTNHQRDNFCYEQRDRKDKKWYKDNRQFDNGEERKWYKDDHRSVNNEDRKLYKDNARTHNREDGKWYKDNHHRDNREDKKWYKNDCRTDNDDKGIWYKDNRHTDFKRNNKNHASNARPHHDFVSHFQKDA